MNTSRLRQNISAQIPESYNPWLHLAGTAGVALVCMIVGAMMVRNPTPMELLTVPVLFLLANVAEWRAHKTLLHKRIWPFYALYDQHTPMHHVMFDYHHMQIHSTRELKLVLMPSVGVATVVLATAPFAYIFGHYFSRNSGWLLLVASGIYVVTYELTHLSYHLPPDSRIGRQRIVRVLREHHRRHHHPRLMQKWNFNVSFPLFDWIRGTIVPPELLARTLAEDRELQRRPEADPARAQ